jgi:hypothetical protein
LRALNRPAHVPSAKVAAPPPKDVPLPKKTLITLGLIVLGSVALSVSALTLDHSWGDDFAAYIMQAQSIVAGDMHGFVQHNAFTIERSAYNIGPVTQLWGFPLVLVPAVAAFGLDLLKLKLVLTLCHTAFLCAFFLLARTRLGDARALMVTALVAFNPVWLQAQNEILSDLPFALFSTLVLWLILRRPANTAAAGRNIGADVLVGMGIFMAAFTRWTGWLLFLPLAATQLPRLRQQALQGRAIAGAGPKGAAFQAAVAYLTFAILYAMQAQLFPSVGYPLRDQFAELSGGTLRANLGYYFWLPAAFFGHVLSGGKAIHVVLLILYVLGAVRRGARDWPIHLYLLATLAVLVAFPAHGGPRFLYALWPLFLLFAFDGLMWMIERLWPARQRAALAAAYALWMGLMLVSLAACAQAGLANLSAGRIPPRAAWGAFSPTSMEMYDFVRARTAPDSVIVFFKPRAMRLMTGRDAILILRCSQLRRGDYVVLNRKVGLGMQVPPREVAGCSPWLDVRPVFENADFVAYQTLRRHR